MEPGSLCPPHLEPETSTAIEKSFGIKAAVEWEGLMKRAEKMWAVSREPFVESEPRKYYVINC